MDIQYLAYNYLFNGHPHERLKRLTLNRGCLPAAREVTRHPRHVNVPNAIYQAAPVHRIVPELPSTATLPHLRTGLLLPVRPYHK
jgi:hypothetical protein